VFATDRLSWSSVDIHLRVFRVDFEFLLSILLWLQRWSQLPKLHAAKTSRQFASSPLNAAVWNKPTLRLILCILAHPWHEFQVQSGSKRKITPREFTIRGWAGFCLRLLLLDHLSSCDDGSLYCLSDWAYSGMTSPLLRALPLVCFVDCRRLSTSGPVCFIKRWGSGDCREISSQIA